MTLDLTLVWGTPGDVEQDSDGGGDYASTFKLTPRGVAKVVKALGMPGEYRYAEFCGCRAPREGDGVHVAGEPSDLICLASPIAEGSGSTDSARAPWDDPSGCFAHCDPEGWHAPCRKPTEP